MTPILLAAALIAAEPPKPSAEPKPVAATRLEVKELLEGHKTARPRLPMPPPGDGRGVNNGRFREFYLPDFRTGGAGGRDPDPAMTLDNTFKVKLFWVTSRANNCYYCLGHQEHKLAAAGVSDDDIAALDGDWAGMSDKEKAALAFTRKLTVEPHAVTVADIDGLKAYYTPTQVLEILVTVAGYNSTNRWTDGLNIPAEENAAFFRKAESKADLSTFKTPTSAKFAGLISRVATLPKKCDKASQPAWPPRPALEDRAAVEAALKAAADRKPVLPLADAAGPYWVKLLTTFPKAGASRVAAHKTAEEKGELSPRVKAEIAWAAARTDRAWYAVAVARDRLRAVGFSDDQVFALDADSTSLPESERAAMAFARKLTAAPATVTDMDVEGLRKLFSDKQVAEIVYQVCTAAFFDRVTEAAKLPLER